MSEKVVVIGGGLAGLSAAALLARSGAQVTLLEKAREPGGRGRTDETKGFHLNLGPHALYKGGPAESVLTELGIVPSGGVPSVGGARALLGERTYTLPTGPLSLLTTGLLSGRAKLEALRVLGSLARIDAPSLASVSIREWLDRTFTTDARAWMQAFLRLTTYSGADEDSAGAALAQAQVAAVHGVVYVDGGWATIARALRDAAERAGATIHSSARVVAIEEQAGAVVAVRTSDERFACDAVVVATPPRDAAELLPALADQLHALEPVHAACLDVALAALPRPANGFALGIDRPLYFSVHTKVAKLAPAGGHVVHVARYGGAVADPRETERELEAVLDQLQPGWRAHVVERRFMPHLLVQGARVLAKTGGLAGRPRASGIEGVGLEGVHLAGDWVGPEGLLADASFASARAAAREILSARTREPVRT